MNMNISEETLSDLSIERNGEGIDIKEKYYSAEQLCSFINISESFFYELKKRYGIPDELYLSPKCIRYRLGSFLEHIRSLKDKLISLKNEENT